MRSATPWIFDFLASQPCPFGKIQRDPLLYPRFHLIFSSLEFLNGDPKLLEDPDWDFRSIWPWCYVSIFLEVSVLVSGLLVPPTELSLHQSCGIILCPLVPFQKGYPSFSEGLLCHCNKFPVKSPPCLLLTSLFNKEGLKGLYSLLSDGIPFCRYLSSFISRGVEN